MSEFSAKASDCPDTGTLVNYLIGKLPLELIDSCESHLAKCVQCEETLQGLSASDTLDELAAEAIEQLDSPMDENDQTALLALIDRLQSDDMLLNRRDSLDDRAAEVTRLLEQPRDPADLGALAHYAIVELVGAGSTGVVFRAIDQQLDREVALKVLRPSLGDAARERFMAEARTAAGIDHANVITIYHVGVENDLAYIAMQWVPGETLEDRLGKVTFMPESDVRKITQEICSGLQAAHEKNLIHRDIKPANIWLRENGDQAIILDFGLARVADDDPHMTNTGMLAGTPNFMSPEQTKGLELDGRSDLFSLGCTMYRAVTGKLPFGSTGILATLQSIQNDTPAAPSQLNPHVSSDFSDLIMCLLEKQPIDRPEGTIQLIEALENPKSRWPFAPPNVSLPSRSSKDRSQNPSTRNAWIGWTTAAIVMLVLLGWFGFAFGPQIIRIVTDQGELIIDAKDENIKIEILENGDLVRVIDTATDQRIDIKSGEYSVQVRDDRNSFELTPDRIVMKRGGRAVVAVTKQPRSDDTAVTPSSAFSDNPPLDIDDQDLARFLKPGAIASLEHEELDAMQQLAHAQETLKYSKELHAKGYITQRQLKQDELAVEAARLQVENAEGDLRTAKAVRLKMIERRKELNQLAARKLEVLREKYEAVKSQAEAGMVTSDVVHQAELEYLDAQMQLLRTADASSTFDQASDTIDPRIARYVTELIKKYDRNSNGRLESEERENLRMLVKDFDDDGVITRRELELFVAGRDSSSEAAFPDPALSSELAGSKNAMPTYDGNTFEEWLSILKTERNHETIRKGLLALGELSAQSPELQDRALATVTKLARERGSMTVGRSNNEVVEQITRFFSYLPPEKIIDFIVSEIPAGTRQSRQQLVWLLMPGNLFQYQPEKQEPYREILRSELDRIISVSLQHAEQSTDENVDIALHLIAWALRACYTEAPNQFASNMADASLKIEPLDPPVEQRLVEWLDRTEKVDVQATVASYLAYYQSESPAAKAVLVASLNDPELSPIARTAVFYAIARAKFEEPEPLIKALMVLYDNPELRTQIAPYAPGGGWVQVVGSDSVGSTLIQNIERFGAKATIAVPWLAEIAESDSPNASAARTAVQKITADASSADDENS